MLVIRYDVELDRIRRKMAAEKRQEALEAERLVAAVPYSGSIAFCQASVPDSGRSVGSHRCTRAPRFVIQKREWDGEAAMAVCALHAAKPRSRYRTAYKHLPDADEPIEPPSLLHQDT